MGLFILGVLVGGAVTAILLYRRTPQDDPSPKEETAPQKPAVREKETPSEKPVQIPVEVLPNLYSLELHDITMKHHISSVGNSMLNYVTMGFRFSYKLNGRKEGKRRLIITSYNSDRDLLEIKGDFTPFVFTETGADVMQVCFNNCEKHMPAWITVLVREGAKD